MKPVHLDLRTARALRHDLRVRLARLEERIDDDLMTALRRLARAIARAERELRPGRWRVVSAYGTAFVVRWWPSAEDGEVWLAAEVVGGAGWRVYAPDGDIIASGAETGAEGRRKADAALRRWLKRTHGVQWEGR